MDKKDKFNKAYSIKIDKENEMLVIAPDETLLIVLKDGYHNAKDDEYVRGEIMDALEISTEIIWTRPTEKSFREELKMNLATLEE